MTNIHVMFPSIYISAYDLGGKHIPLEIERVQGEKVERQNKKTKRMEKVTAFIVYFKGAKKGLLLNKTNAKRIAALYGDESDSWIGKRITLYSENVQAFGESVDAVRVEERRPLVKNGTTIEEPPAELNIEGVPDDDEAPEFGATETNINEAAGLQ